MNVFRRKTDFSEYIFSTLVAGKHYFPSKHKPYLVTVNVYAMKIVVVDPLWCCFKENSIFPTLYKKICLDASINKREHETRSYHLLIFFINNAKKICVLIYFIFLLFIYLFILCIKFRTLRLP